MLHRQQPHRQGGRIRRDRQFGSNLRVAGGEMATAPSNGERLFDDDHEIDGSSAIVNRTSATAAVAGAKPKPPCSSALMELFDDDDDDDDDGLLSYVAFNK